jgi:membrane protease YdiL (CAAX protease family)
MQKPDSVRSYSLTILTLVYLIIRFAFTSQLDALGMYSSYIFEVTCMVIAIALVGKKMISNLSFTKPALYCAPTSLAAGFGIYKMAGALGILIPFNFTDTESLIFLLLVAPILEEAVFRFFLWQSIQISIRNRVITLVLTSLIFSYSHLHAIWFVAPEIQNFVIYQASYTLPLGLACGLFVYRYASLTSAIVLHFAFNLGFYIASLS